MIESKKQDVIVHVDPISLISEIQIIEGNTSQVYDNETHEYVPDRSILPCVLMPFVQVSDPENLMTGEAAITSCMWYEGAPKSDNSNQITSATPGYEVSKEGKPKYSLTVKKNFGVNNPVDIHAIYTFIDKRTDSEVKVERQISFQTNLFVNSKYTVMLDCPSAWCIDPTGEVADEVSGKWLHTINATLMRGTKKVLPANAAFWWQISEDGNTFRDFTQEEQEAFVSGKDISGHWTGSITFDARLFRKVTFRVVAEFFDAERPAMPKSDLIQATTTVKVELPRTMKIDVIQTMGMRVTASMTQKVQFKCIVSDNRGTITNKNMYRVHWYARSGRPGVADKQIGSTETITFIPKDLGFDTHYGIAVYAKVYVYAIHALVTNATGQVITNNNKAIITPKYE